MRSLPQRRAWAPALLAAGWLWLAGCSSPPPSATSGPDGVSTADVAINYVDHHYVEDEAFRRISEYLDGQENKGGRIIERTDPKQRAGYYFIIDLAWHSGVTLPAGTQAELDYIRNDNPATHTANFTFSSDTGTWPEIFLGLTGADWTNKDVTITAYKLTLKDPSGKVLASRQSFLWGLPETTAPGATATANAAPVTANP